MCFKLGICHNQKDKFCRHYEYIHLGSQNKYDLDLAFVIDK